MPPKGHPKEFPLTPEQKKELDEFTARKNEISVAEWKALGNRFFGQESYLSSIKCYTQALERHKADRPSDAEAERKHKAEMAILFSNRSAAYLKSTMFSGPVLALKDGQEALKCQPTWPKAYLRVGDAQYNRKQWAEAKAAYETALGLDPNCEAAKISLKATQKELFLAELDEKAKQEEKEEMKEGRNKKIDKGEPIEPEIQFLKPEDPFLDPAKVRQKEKEEETSRFIHSLAKEVSVAENRTGMKPRTVSLEEADRQLGVDYKRQLLGNFRRKINENDSFRKELEEKAAAVQYLGEGTDYRRAEDYYNTYARSTNGIGLSITTDAYKDHVGTAKYW